MYTSKQVFNETMYPEVIANLTNPDILRARLTDIDVLPNEFLGVFEAYTLKELIIISQEKSTEFLDSFQDSVNLKKHLAKEWPNAFPVAMPKFEANMLCMFTEFKIQKYADEIKSLLMSGDKEGEEDRIDDDLDNQSMSSIERMQIE